MAFRFVCKAWLIVVNDPDFVKMHLNRGSINGGGRGTSSSSSNNNYQSLMCASGTELFQVHFHFSFGDVPPPPNSDSDDYNTVTYTLTEPDVESFPFNSRLNLVGSCNGLVCIDSGEFLVLLNPCTRRYKLSPSDPFPYMALSYEFGCFYDSTTTTAECKVVRIAHNGSKSEVNVYSMSTNSWKTVKDITNDIHKMINRTTIEYRPGVFLNGALHWMSNVTSDLISFDMRSEEFREMPRPPYDGNKDIKVLMIMRGCLGMIRVRGYWNLEISIMKEYGVSESWTREFVIPWSSNLEVSSGLRSIVCLGDQIIINKMCGRMVLHDMNKKTSVYIQGNGFPGVRFVCRMVPCTESLVSLKLSVLPLSKDRKRKMESPKDRKRRMESLDTEIK